MNRWLTATGGALLVIAAMGCASSGVNKGDVNLISVQEEWQLGQQLSDQLAQKLTLVQDPWANQFVGRIGQRIVRQTPMANLPWHFYIVADPAVNAFNIPGGHVYVNTGLIESADDVAQLAGVMAHEISHGVARHGTEQLTKQYGFEILAGLVLGKDPSVTEKVVAQIVAGGAFARFSRDDEKEADELGVRYMYEAGYDPAGMAGMFENLLEIRQNRPNAVERFFSTHPLTEERIRDVRREAADLPPKQGLIDHAPDFRRLQQRLRR